LNEQRADFINQGHKFMRRLRFITVLALTIIFFARPGRAQDANTAPLYLFTTGSGNIFPYQDGQLLNVGQDYEMTAVPDPGFVFSSWEQVNVFTIEEFTIDANGNPNPPIISQTISPAPPSVFQPVLDFTMQPETVILNIPGVRSVTQDDGWQANFVPTPEPSTIALVACGLVMLVFSFRARLAILMRKFRLIALVALTTLWFPHSSHAQNANNAPLYLFTTGSGEISQLSNGQILNVGQDYEMTATPNSGFVFSSWQPVNVTTVMQFDTNTGTPIGTPTMVVSPGADYSFQPVLDFTMQPEELITDTPTLLITSSSGWQANFTPTPEPSTLALVVCGLMFLAHIAGRRVRSWAIFEPRA
jgi:Divergent InlB B-repeat domain